MATLRHSATGRLHRLGAHDLVGRSPNCQLTLRDAHISGEHAAFRWSGDGWELRDLSSRNGTFVGGQRMDAGQRVQIKPGDALTVRIWRTGAGEAVFTTSVGDRTVIDQGLVRHS